MAIPVPGITILTLFNQMKPIKITVNDRMQRDYLYWLTVPEGKEFDSRFKPSLTPKEMLMMGVFGGKYLTDCTAEFPHDWFTQAILSPQKADPQLNYYHVSASQSLSIWRQKGWLHPDDPRGWFQWYCRYYRGRRHPDDDRQVKRWLAMKRHISQIKNHCLPFDETCRRRQRQALLHWAYDSRQI